MTSIGGRCGSCNTWVVLRNGEAKYNETMDVLPEETDSRAENKIFPWRDHLS